jgi:trans-2,3-dihydro-3-hydroxyanthranilate isomerase
VPTLPYHVVDVFTDRAFAGNPLAVVLDADDLPTESLQAIASEFHLSETAFPMRSAVADYRLRIFTPIQELPFAGHPSVGSAWLLARLRRIRPGEVTQECGAGLLPVEVTETGAKLTGGPPSHGEALDPALWLSLFGLGPPEAAPVAPRVAGCGLSFLYLPVQRAAVATVTPDERAIRQAVAEVGAIGVAIVAWDGQSRRAHARVFVPGVGEDPATGSAAVGLGVFLAVNDLVPPGARTAYTVDQGTEIGRPSVLECTVTRDGAAVASTTVAGSVTQVASGELLRPPPPAPMPAR